ncbi:MAG: ABC transporter permease [Gemmatimonadetes bacterium]|nr:ABC transporter permease [Gemmatimonadota bacterium]
MRQLFRDPRMPRMQFGPPLLQLLVFGYAVNTDIRDTRSFIVDRDHPAVSRRLVDALTSSGYFVITGRGERPADVSNALDHGDATIGIDIPEGFAADFAAGRAKVQILVDGTSANSANVAQGYVGLIVQRLGQELGRTGVQAYGRTGVDLQARAWFNPDLRSAVYNVPAVAGMIIMLMGLSLTAMAVVREREIGTLEQLMVSPLRPVELIIGKTLPVVLVTAADLVLVAAVAILWFHVPMRGSYLLLALASLFFILAAIGLGLLISTISSTQQEAFMTMFFFMLPIIILGGFMFPVANMPLPFQWISLLDPVRHYLEVVRGIFLKGAGLEALWRQTLALAVMGPGLLWWAVLRFHKTSA